MSGDNIEEDDHDIEEEEDSVAPVPPQSEGSSTLDACYTDECLGGGRLNLGGGRLTIVVPSTTETTR